MPQIFLRLNTIGRHQQMVAHNLERAADRATNICERAIYVVTGKLIDVGWENDVS